MESVSTEKQLLLQVCHRLASGHLLGGRGQDRNIFLARTSGHKPRSQAEGPYSFLVESVFDSDLMTPAHEMATGFFTLASLLCPSERVLLAQVPQEHCSLDWISISFLVDSLQVMGCALSAEAQLVAPSLFFL